MQEKRQKAELEERKLAIKERKSMASVLAAMLNKFQ